ncbi:MAG: hypothetical protein PHQ64_03735 [Bacilli bacterium]|nr:hypothetical protein [Bacilli bacterium]
MKKMIDAIILLMLCILLSGCVGKKEPVAITLNKDNFEEYIILDVQLNEFEKQSQRGLVTRYEYRGSAKLEAKARLRKDVKVENVIIKGKILTSGWCWAANTYEFTLELDKDGRAEYSETIYSGDYGLASPEEPSISSAIDRWVDVQENEFIVDNIIIQVDGVVYE